jgi:ectoine hydroxylase-related dioxygenase (phytanoyl-CoA dioxygenase family)
MAILSRAQIDEFFQRGFFLLPNVFNKKEVAEMGAALDRITEVAKTIKTTTVVKGTQFVVEGNRIDRVVWVGAIEPVLLKYSEDKRLLEPVSELLESKAMDQLICQFHPKLPGDNVKFDWHQDSSHRRYGTAEWNDVNGKGSYVQALIAIDRVTKDNGPVFFIPGSGNQGHLESPSGKMEDVVDISKAVPLLMEPGDIGFFGPYVVHGSQPNNSNTARRVFINGYAAAGANKRVYPGEGAGRPLHL